MKKIEHLGIAVTNLEESVKTFQQLLGTACYKTETVDSEFVKTAFFHLGETKIELLQATDSRSPIARFIEKRGQGIHHIAFDVEDIGEEMERLKNQGFQVIGSSPKDGADDKLVAFLHPKSTDGVLVELCQDKKKRL